MERKKPIGSAYKELDAMIGLDNAKKALLDAVNYFKAQKIFADMDAFCGKPSLHMVFTGNPGTAKTTAARLFSQIMHENGVLSTGYFVEVGRSDLVGKYVGWTAKIVKEAFRDAKGGVLFIDEAYSLLDDRGGSYGDEAINTIVQEMENMRDDVCVIFAGYPDKMDTFLKRNPGLSSRIAFHVNFPDYSPEELLLISRYIAGGKKRTFSPEAEALLKENFESIHEDRYFGNGRYVRNIIDKALMRQAGRLLRIGYDKVGANDISVITADDIVLDPVNGREAKTIGFR